MKKLLFLTFAVLVTLSIESLAGEKPKQGDKIIVEKIDKEKLTRLLKERKGKPLFLNLWATWCVPCREEFPSINKLADEYKDVEFVGISVDFPEEVETKIIPFLKEQKANFTSYVNAFEGDEALINLLDKNWNGALPATFVFDKNGKKISFLEGKKTFDKFKIEIDKARKK